MKFSLTILTLLILFSCRSLDQTSTANTVTSGCQWGYDYYPDFSDSLGITAVSPGISFDKNCFPKDYFVTTNDMHSINVKVFNRWGVKLYDSSSETQWICNDSESKKQITTGTYFTIVSYSLKSDGIDSVYSHNSNIQVFCK
ncbi:MAG: hypothetical protein COA58_11170 [Bacteroidetes bacterium]|nr:MAG: hypothetical protein COA58_11170 [Bacteroidota bacterium]